MTKNTINYNLDMALKINYSLERKWQMDINYDLDITR
jgi:hypothetical protein